MSKCNTCYTNNEHHDLVCQKPKEDGNAPVRPESAGSMFTTCTLPISDACPYPQMRCVDCGFYK